MQLSRCALLPVSLGLGLLTFSVLADSIRLDQMDLSGAEQDWGKPRADRSVDGHPLAIGSKHFEHGFGTHAVGEFQIDLHGQATRFSASVGVDAEVPQGMGSVDFVVLGDDKTLWDSGVMRGKEEPKALSVDLTGVRHLTLQVGDAGDGMDHDHADWADAVIEYSGSKPEAVAAPPPEQAVILTPPPSAAPRINGPTIFGARPGHLVFYRVPVTGELPIELSAVGVPDGLMFDSVSHLLTGSLPSAGTYLVTFRAKNTRGVAEKKLKVVIGDTLALTPPLGWNSWNCFAGNVDAAKIRSAADAMVSSGLIEHGWTYINIDDTWEGDRDPMGFIQPNDKFQDMKALAEYVHNKGLKIGLYSGPGPKTCAGFEASWKHEQQDAAQYAAWTYDYLKYDWCSYGSVVDKSLSELEQCETPYRVMNAALRAQNRDIVFSLCQYGMCHVWEWGQSVGGNCWRTTGDITDTWHSMCANGFSSVGHEKYAGPGHWNDPDMLVVGNLGWGNVRPCQLTPNEQYTHISLWCLLDSPLLIGCDMSRLDDFTKALLSNDEVLEVNQDELGQQAARVAKSGNLEVWAKDMADGSKAIGLFNRGPAATTMTVNWSDVGWANKHRVHDLWRQQDLGEFTDSFSGTVPRHGVLLVRAW